MASRPPPGLQVPEDHEETPRPGRERGGRPRHKPSSRPILKAVPVQLPPELEAERLRDRAIHEAAWMRRFGKSEVQEPVEIKAEHREHEDWAKPRGLIIDRGSAQIIGRALRDRRIEAIDRRWRQTARLWASVLRWVDEAPPQHRATLQRPPCERRMAELVIFGQPPEALLKYEASQETARIDPDELLREIVELWAPEADRTLLPWDQSLHL